MASTATFVAVCLLATVADGYVNGAFSGFGAFSRFPSVPFNHHLYKPLRLPGRFPQPTVLPFFGNQDVFNYQGFSSLSGVEKRRPSSGGSFSGFSMSSTNNGQGSMTVISTNENGKTQTFISDPDNPDGPLISLPPLNMEIPDIVMPDISLPKITMPDVSSIDESEFSKSDSIDMTEEPPAPGETRHFQAKSIGSVMSMNWSSNGGPPKIIAKTQKMTNVNGVVKKEVHNYQN